MDRTQIETLLNDVRDGRTAVTDALDRLRDLPFEDIGFAKLDHHRALRTGMPEVIFGSGKTAAQVATIFSRMAQHGGNVLATRVSADMFRAVRDLETEDQKIRAEYHETARCITLTQSPVTPGKGTIAVVCAGTSDLPVAEEAAVTARLMGNAVELIADVGVAGIHRLLAQKGSLYVTRPTLNTYGAKRENLVALAKELFEVVLSGAVKIEVNQTYPLKEAARARARRSAKPTKTRTRNPSSKPTGSVPRSRFRR